MRFVWLAHTDPNGHRIVPVPDVDNLYRLPEDQSGSDTSESDDYDMKVLSGPSRLTTGPTIFPIMGMDY